MRSRLSAAIGAAALLVITGCTATDAATTAPPATPPAVLEVPAVASGEAFTPVVGEVLAPPQLVPASDGLTHLAYELVLTNVLGQQVTIDSIVVHGDGSEDALMQLSDEKRSASSATRETVTCPTCIFT